MVIADLLASRQSLTMSDCDPSSSDLRQGVTFIVSAMLILPGIDAIAKGLSDNISAGEVAWTRHVLQTLFLLPFMLNPGAWRNVEAFWLNVTRGVLMAGLTVMFFSALAMMPIADAIALFFVGPLIFTLLSAIFLGEQIGWRRGMAVFVGFSGALLIIQPSYSIFGVTALLPVGTAFCFAIYMVLTRKLARHGTVADAIGMQFYVGLYGALVLTLALAFGHDLGVSFLAVTIPNGIEWGLLLLLGVIATGGHILIALAARRIGAAQIAPFQYLEIVGATSLGFIFFDDFPDPLTWLGITIIVGSGLYVYFRERRLALEREAHI
ncbi:MAG: EamA family transporter [Rickettsiales bacterium]|nr:EamA family transporter [Rickettsiales bacterium]